MERVANEFSSDRTQFRGPSEKLKNMDIPNMVCFSMDSASSSGTFGFTADRRSRSSSLMLLIMDLPKHSFISDYCEYIYICMHINFDLHCRLACLGIVPAVHLPRLESNWGLGKRFITSK